MKRGYTLIELLIVIAIVGIAGTVLVSAVGGNVLYAEKRRAHAEAAARAYGAVLDPSVPADAWVASCMGVDSDNDGYLSCTLAARGRQPTPVECRAWIWIGNNDGCRMGRQMRPVLIQ